MGLCKDCHWWVVPANDEDRDSIPPQYGTCLLATKIGSLIDHPDSLALVDSPFGRGGDLYTAPTFGCVQFTPSAARSESGSAGAAEGE